MWTERKNTLLHYPSWIKCLVSKVLKYLSNFIHHDWSALVCKKYRQEPIECIELLDNSKSFIKRERKVA